MLVTRGPSVVTYHEVECVRYVKRLCLFFQMMEDKVKKLRRGSSQLTAESMVHSVLDPLSATLEGTDPLSMMAAQAAAATQVTDPLSQMAAAATISSPLTDPLSPMSISKV